MSMPLALALGALIVTAYLAAGLYMVRRIAQRDASYPQTDDART